MRLLCAIIVAGLCCLTVRAEDWTLNGKTLRNVTVGQVEAENVHITYDGGVGSVALADLPPDLQKRFNYDPAKAKAAEAKKEEEAKPDWKKINDVSLRQWVSKVEQITNVASTPAQKAQAETMQIQLQTLHTLLNIDPDSASPSTGDDADKQIIAELRDAASILGKVTPQQLQNIVDNYMNRSVCIGMPKRLAILAWGPPESITSSTSNLGVIETISYPNYASTITVRDGVVIDVTVTQKQ